MPGILLIKTKLNRTIMNLMTSKQRIKTALVITLTASTLMTKAVFASTEPFNKKIVLIETPGEEKPAKKSKLKVKSNNMASLNNSSVKIYPDIIKRDMHVVAKDNDGKEIDFFVFDMEGALVHHYKMKAKDHNKISGLARGTYVYRVFNGDTETATGNFEIR
jgi:hypothetical protein